MPATDGGPRTAYDRGCGLSRISHKIRLVYIPRFYIAIVFKLRKYTLHRDRTGDVR